MKFYLPEKTELVQFFVKAPCETETYRIRLNKAARRRAARGRGKGKSRYCCSRPTSIRPTWLCLFNCSCRMHNKPKRRLDPTPPLLLPPPLALLTPSL